MRSANRRQLRILNALAAYGLQVLRVRQTEADAEAAVAKWASAKAQASGQSFDDFVRTEEHDGDDFADLV